MDKEQALSLVRQYKQTISGMFDTSKVYMFGSYSKGYASPEGSAEINQRLATKRAENVKKALMTKYGIKEDRIQAEGKGVGDSFSEPDWNRVSICTIMQ